MRSDRGQPLFNNRYDAGRQLAAKLNEYKKENVKVLAIPNGGVPIGLEVALYIDAELDLTISRKIPLPNNPEAGFGALAEDGTFVVNQELVTKYGLSQHEVHYQINKVRAEIKQRNLLYRQNKPAAKIEGETVIVTDDGLASGYTMMATVQALRQRKPSHIIVAVPVASAPAHERVNKVADRLVTLMVGNTQRFAVADFYRSWRDLGENEVVQCLKEWQLRRSRSGIEPLMEK
jgi:putative phosphoribosyl transferase